MIANIHSTYLKGEKAFNSKKLIEAKKHLVSVVEHDANYYAAYLLLFEILNNSQPALLKTVVKELKRLNPKIALDYKPVSRYKKTKKDTSIVTISYIKLMIQQGKAIQAKRSLNAIINHAKTKKQILEAETLLKTLNKKKDQK
jgi:flagellar basal body rod protein FlgC